MINGKEALVWEIAKRKALEGESVAIISKNRIIKIEPTKGGDEMDSCETNRDHVVRDLRYLKSYGKVSNNQTIYEIAESALALLKEQEDEKKRIMNVIWDVLHEGLSIDTIADQDWVYEQIRHRIEDT